MKTFYIIDGHALCYRAYYAFIKNPLINSQGENTSAIFGFTRMLLELVNKVSPDYLAVAFDPPKKSFRFDMYPEYKANRKKMPDDLRSQIELIKETVNILGIPSIIAEGYEADDVLGTIANKYSKEYEIFLVTGDKDAYQLVNKSVKIFANSKGVSEFTIFDADAVKEKLGITPEQVIDYMAIVGDTADNIPGIKGVGPKSAQKLIGQYGTLDAIYENIEDLKGKQKSLFEELKDNAYLSRNLVTIKQDIPLSFDISDAEFKGFDNEKCYTHFQDFEMPSIANEFKDDAECSDTNSAHDADCVDYKLVMTTDELDEAVKVIESHQLIAVDTETTSVKPVEADLVGISISIDENQGYYFPMQSGGLFNDNGPEYTLETLLSKLKKLLENPSIKKIGQNIKYDIILFKNNDISLKGVFFDTMIASYILNPARRHNMDDLAFELLNYTTIKYSDLVGKGKNARELREVPLDEVAVYACEDTDITFRLYNKLNDQLEKIEPLKKLFYDIEMPLIDVLVEMETNGVLLDTKHYTLLSKKADEEILKTTNRIHKLADSQFNINSTKELSGILFDKLGLKPVKKTKTGFSTDISVLEALKNDHEIIPEIIRYRTLSKLKNTYIDTLPKLVFNKTGRIHTSYNQTVAATGRLSSSDPNLQNIPVKDEFGKHLRAGFIAEKGFTIFSADYSQIELRLAAHISEDESMISAFKEGIDIHSLTASNVFGVSIDSVESWMRRQAKIINFSTIYGVSPYGLSKQSDISISEAKSFIDKYFETYPGFKDYIEKTKESCRKSGYVETLCGRRRYLPEINSSNQIRREGAERIAINTPIQGSSADMIKIAMININNYLKEENKKTRLLMQVHDELIFELHENEQDLIPKIVKMMETVFTLTVPVTVDWGNGSNWEEAH